MENTIILTGGGTAGHVSVNINLQNELKKHFKNIIYIGSKNGIEKELICKRTDYKFMQITTVKFERRKFFKNIAIPFKLKKGISEAKKILKQERPSVIFSKGGYVGLPVVIAGKKLGIPVICHESDLSMGLANKLAKKYATTICTNFKVTAEQNGEKCVHTGMPLISSPLSKEQAKQKLGIKTSKPVLLITGGSLGCKAINEFIFNNINELTKNYFVYHLSLAPVSTLSSQHPHLLSDYHPKKLFCLSYLHFSIVHSIFPISQYHLTAIFWHDPHFTAKFYSKYFFTYCPVYEFFFFAISSGVPIAITVPPLSPPSGPISII